MLWSKIKWDMFWHNDIPQDSGGRDAHMCLQKMWWGGGEGWEGDQSHSFQLAARGRERRLKFTGKELADIIIIFDAAFQKT